MNGDIHNPQGEQLDYAFHAGSDNSKRLVLIGHGVTGDKDRPWAQALAEAIADAGNSALRFSFSGNGQSQGDFRDCTISKEVTDLSAVIDAAQQAGFEDIGYAGHSMGGAVGVLSAANDSRLSFLISLAGMVHTAKFAQVEFGDQIPDQGFMWDEKDCPLSAAFVNDLTQIDTLLPLSNEIKIPWLLIHGDQDDVVPIEESRQMFEQASNANTHNELIEIPESNHVFADAGLHPMISAVTQWVGAL
ncbi:MAG: alpha/beta fold hydrolase [Verrucomicrobiales bacterium]|nr:alpha/beta fold hydrolase [Verrucomicrobiales bacterium]